MGRILYFWEFLFHFLVVDLLLNHFGDSVEIILEHTDKIRKKIVAETFHQYLHAYILTMEHFFKFSLLIIMCTEKDRFH